MKTLTLLFTLTLSLTSFATSGVSCFGDGVIEEITTTEGHLDNGKVLMEVYVKASSLFKDVFKFDSLNEDELSVINYTQTINYQAISKDKGKILVLSVSNDLNGEQDVQGVAAFVYNGKLYHDYEMSCSN